MTDRFVGSGPGPASPDEGAALIAKLRARDPDAYQLIDALYTRRLIGLARARLPARVAAKIGAEDIVQSVLRSFFVRSERGEFDAIDDAEGCWRVLALITRRKCGHKADYYLAERRSIGREADLEAAWEAVARGPTAEEAVTLIETIEGLGRDFDPHQVQMLGLFLEGRPPAEVAELAGFSRRTVERFRDRLRERLRRLMEGDASEPEGARPLTLTDHRR